MSIHSALLLTIGLTSLFLGLAILFRDAKSSANKTFALFSFVVIIWIATNYLVDHPVTNELALFWNKLNLTSAMSMAVVVFYLSLVFPNKSEFPKWLKGIFLFISLILVFLSLFTNLSIKEISFENWGTNATAGPLFSVVIGWSIISIIGMALNLGLKYRRVNDSEKRQLKYLLLGIVLAGVFGLFFGALLPAITQSYELAKYSPYGIIFLLFFTAYAISQYHLFDIRVIATELLVLLINLVLLVQLLLSKTIQEGLLRAVFLGLMIYFGYLLIKSVIEEIRRRKEIEKLAERLRVANVKLKEVDRLKSEFISMASHQLRTPLSIIKGYLHTLKVGKVGELTEKQEHFIKTAMEANDQLIAIIDDFLNLGRIEENRIMVEFEKVDLREVVATVIERMQSLAIKKEITIHFEKPEDFPKIEADKAKLVEIITNLVDNSIKYGKEKGMIRLELKDMEDEVAIVEEDDGMGIPDDFKERLFKKFNRAKNAVKAMPSGNGIGLYLVKKIIDLHHGKVFAESHEDEGTKFTIILPIKQPKRGEGENNEKSANR